MAVERRLPTPEAAELLELARELAEKELRPRAAEGERSAAFPRDVFRTIGRAGLLGLPYPERYGGGGQPYEVYLQVVEELAGEWLTVGLGLSVHTLACFPVAEFGTEEQRAELLPGMLGGESLGAYCLSEAHSGSDAAALSTRAEAVAPGAGPDAAGGYRVRGAKSWITHGGVADFYTLFARTGEPGSGAGGISCFHVPASAAGLAADPPEHKMGLNASPTAVVRFDDVAVPAGARIGAEGRGFTVALAALDSGRLGIAAGAVGVAQAALDLAVEHARQRRQFGRPIGEFQGVSFLLADMATQVAAARELYLAAARLRDAGRPFGTRAAMAKLFATDTAMRVTTDAVQVLGGSGYTADLPAERLMREAKVLQIVEGTNQIQRLVIGRDLLRQG
ncbi:acyl-CoA dehydrogenase family protein [Marinitenerispora sediminis]|uniref:Acyl-CoA dehydrogenase n=1 Tax=Marinitenerispora sediminis TaxID=1931232 RepID=A0A368T805_9ACTN|nr:acyl-CoA dehydrogenase family protein [Marinitenerispora sediminis]RCV51164.1 acyl-CoA dehydrogenase [Marinitenerispora sediminis]RCV57069.1 acyl-CoA dehydrogenase [Marinitenerispora sediminis]RCV59958.1 acyl-CoA dehydrogenase [Marinitenerispora sediminis]